MILYIKLLNPKKMKHIIRLSLFVAFIAGISFLSSCNKDEEIACPMNEQEIECGCENADLPTGGESDGSGRIDIGNDGPEPGQTEGTGPFPTQP
jgi:hypothetical protein